MKLNQLNKIAFGGGCHWCTEAVFQSLIGVEYVEQGYVASTDENSSFSEAVIVHFNNEEILLKTLIEVHLYTHKSSSDHSMRTKYRSAIYVFSKKEEQQSKEIIREFQKEFENKLITQVYSFQAFKQSNEVFQNYYQKNPKKPFCETFINPKLRVLLERFSIQTDTEKLKHLI